MSKTYQDALQESEDDPGFQLVSTWRAGEGQPPGGEAWGPMVDQLRVFLDAVAGSVPDQGTIGELEADLRAWTARLSKFAVPEREQAFCRRADLPGRGQTMAPVFHVLGGNRNRVRGTTRFGRYFLGGNGAAHGGAIPMLFDEVLGRTANCGGRPRARTAYLNVNFRSITPLEKDLDVTAWFVREEGRKRIVRGEIRDGERLCAEAEGLFLTLLPGQP